jgi:hypothetical protein
VLQCCGDNGVAVLLSCGPAVKDKTARKEAKESSLVLTLNSQKDPVSSVSWLD